MKKGPGALTDAQLLAVILRTGAVGKDAVDLANEILSLRAGHSGILSLCHISRRELLALHGIGDVKSIQVLCIGELSRRIAAAHMPSRKECSSPEQIAGYYMEELRHLEREKLICLILDNKNRLIGETVLSTGTVNATLFSVRDLFILLLKEQAVRFALLHNHPSGDPTPSREDESITRKALQAGEILSVPMVDHIIIGDRKYYSFLEHGKIR